jgi:hypothetical protein
MPGPRNMFDALISNPDLQGAMAGAFAPGPGTMNPALVHAAATGQVQTQMPRTGLGALGARLGLWSPQQQIDPMTQDLESLIVQQKMQQELERKQNAVIGFAGMVSKIGGPAAVALAPDYFGPMLTDPDLQNKFKAVLAYHSTQQQRLEEDIRHHKATEAAATTTGGIRTREAGVKEREIGLREKTEKYKEEHPELSKGGKEPKTPQDIFEETATRKLADPENAFTPEQLEQQATMESRLGIPPDKGIFQMLARAARANPPKPGQFLPDWLSGLINSIYGTLAGEDAGAPAAASTPAPAPSAKPSAKATPVVPF